ncbi:MAG: ATP-binding protein [Pseudomonadota bacterium]
MMDPSFNPAKRDGRMTDPKKPGAQKSGAKDATGGTKPGQARPPRSARKEAGKARRNTDRSEPRVDFQFVDLTRSEFLRPEPGPAAATPERRGAARREPAELTQKGPVASGEGSKTKAAGDVAGARTSAKGPRLGGPPPAGPAARGFESVWQALPQAALMLSPDNGILEANGAAEAFLGQGQALLRRAKLNDFVVEGSRLLDLVERARRGGQSLSEYGVELQLRERPPCVVDVQAAQLFDQGKGLLLLIQTRSVTAAMDRSMMKPGANRSLSGLSSAMAHEIKNPLAAISGAAQLLEMTLGDDENELLHLIQEEAERIRSLVERMDAFGDRTPLSRAPVNIHDVLDQARRSAAAGYGRNVRFKAQYDPSLPPVPGDKGQLLQAVTNLVKNAVEAAPSYGGEVSLTSAYRPGVKIAVAGGARERLPLEVAVIDNGQGVPEELRPHIFEPFVTSKANGTGLGLPLVAKIVADHGGVIEYVRRRERSAFLILLPVWRDAEDPTSDDSAGEALE